MNGKHLKIFSNFIAFILVSSSLAACQVKPEVKSPEQITEPKVSALGRIQPETDIRRVGVAGAVSQDRIEEIFVKENQIVKKGEALARLNSYEALNAALEEAIQYVAVAKSKLEQVKAGAKKGEIKAQEYKIESLKRQLEAERKSQDEIVARRKFQFEESKRQHERYHQLFKEGAVSASEVDRYLVSLQTAEKNLAEAKETRIGKLRVLEAQIDEAIQTLDKIAEVRPVDVNVAEAELQKAIALKNKAEKEFSFATILAPQDGQILSILARPGDKVTVEGIFQMADTSKMIAVAEVYQTDMPKIFIGQKAQITSDGFSKSIEGTVYELGSQVTRQKIFAGRAGENLDARVVEVKLRLNPKDIEEGVKRASNLQVNVVFEPNSGRSPG